MSEDGKGEINVTEQETISTVMCTEKDLMPDFGKKARLRRTLEERRKKNGDNDLAVQSLTSALKESEF